MLSEEQMAMIVVAVGVAMIMFSIAFLIALHV